MVSSGGPRDDLQTTVHNTAVIVGKRALTKGGLIPVLSHGFEFAGFAQSLCKEDQP